ncbi:MAG TPA: FHA domain-containing protein [Polyangiaceae bacterium]|nr:FHA domain-containing protein [Polyangiaceae bacterium]
MPPDQTSNRPTLTDMPAVGAIRVWLRFGDHDVEVAQGETILGRSPKCAVVLDDPLVSRQHARLVVNRGAVTIEDLGSSNGVLVNGERLMRARVLVSGDRVVIGHQTFMLLSAETSPADAAAARKERIGAETLAGPQQQRDSAPAARQEPIERTEATRKGHALELLGSVAEKVLALGRGDEAERILSSYLRNYLQTARIGGEMDAETADRAALYAVRIAEATGKGGWIDYVFELYTVAKRPLPNVVVEKLYECLRKLSPVSISVFRQYLSALRGVEAQLGPAERFVLRRIEGLEALGVLK